MDKRIEFLQANGKINDNRQQKTAQMIRKKPEMSHKGPQLDEKNNREMTTRTH